MGRSVPPPAAERRNATGTRWNDSRRLNISYDWLHSGVFVFDSNISQGFFRDVEVFMGVNRDEGSIFLANTMPEIFMKGPVPNITRDEASLYMVFFFQYILR